jgi:hypothetical protein
MTQTEKFSNLSGSDKKNLTLNVIHRIISELNIPEEEKTSINTLIDDISSDLIEKVVHFSKNLSKNGNKICKKFFGIFRCCNPSKCQCKLQESSLCRCNPCKC